MPDDPQAPEQTDRPADGREPVTGAPAGPESAADAAPPEPQLPSVVPVLATGPNVLFPATVIPFISADEAAVRAID
jgi:hypothetical protein